MHLETLQRGTRQCFGDVGIAYVYFTYGMHHCFNIVARHPKIDAGAVLIRGIMPGKGIKKMQENRGKTELKNLTNGPAKIAQALEITKKQYGTDLTKKSEIYITEGTDASYKISARPRIGIKDARNKLWNFKIENKI